MHVNTNDRSISYRVNQQAATSGLWLQVREIYETAIEAEAPYGLPDEDCKKMCLRYTHMHFPLLCAQSMSGNIDRIMNIRLCADSIMCTNAESHCQGCSARLARMVVDKLMVPTALSTTQWTATAWTGGLMCAECRYAKLERGLGEVDRARAIYVHASAMADPRRDTGFWADWNAFEVGCIP